MSNTILYSFMQSRASKNKYDKDRTYWYRKHLEIMSTEELDLLVTSYPYQELYTCFMELREYAFKLSSPHMIDRINYYCNKKDTQTIQEILEQDMIVLQNSNLDLYYLSK